MSPCQVAVEEAALWFPWDHMALWSAEPAPLPAQHLGAKSTPKLARGDQSRDGVLGSNGAGVSWLQAGEGQV